MWTSQVYGHHDKILTCIIFMLMILCQLLFIIHFRNIFHCFKNRILKLYHHWLRTTRLPRSNLWDNFQILFLNFSFEIVVVFNFGNALWQRFPTSSQRRSFLIKLIKYFMSSFLTHSLFFPT